MAVCVCITLQQYANAFTFIYVNRLKCPCRMFFITVACLSSCTWKQLSVLDLHSLYTGSPNSHWSAAAPHLQSLLPKNRTLDFLVGRSEKGILNPLRQRRWSLQRLQALQLDCIIVFSFKSCVPLSTYSRTSITQPSRGNTKTTV